SQETLTKKPLQQKTPNIEQGKVGAYEKKSISTHDCLGTVLDGGWSGSFFFIRGFLDNFISNANCKTAIWGNGGEWKDICNRW
ncbi:hypothetical protein MUP38_07070, partial [Candidatus Bathyarchaeota archaeon]|nr:hypothetical protein [Candidatus Bathyarchaeota archaeon]